MKKKIEHHLLSLCYLYCNYKQYLFFAQLHPIRKVFDGRAESITYSIYGRAEFDLESRVKTKQNRTAIRNERN